VAGLGALMRLKARGRFRHPLELIVFRGEESSRFGIHTMGSKAMSGMATVDAWQRLKTRPARRSLKSWPPAAWTWRGYPRRLGGRRAEGLRRGPHRAVLRARAGRIPIGVVEAIAARSD